MLGLVSARLTGLSAGSDLSSESDRGGLDGWVADVGFVHSAQWVRRDTEEGFMSDGEGQGQPTIKGVKELVAEAENVIETRTGRATPSSSTAGRTSSSWTSGTCASFRATAWSPAPVHAPRGMLEFWFDPGSPYHREVFAQGKEYVLYCASGWRSALATRALKEMGFDRVSHVGGGFTGWKEAGGPVADKKK